MPVRSEPAPSFAALLRQHRHNQALSQEVLAERAGLSVRGLSDLERGARRSPQPGTVSRLASALGLESEARATLASAARPLHLRQPRPTRAHPTPCPRVMRFPLR